MGQCVGEYPVVLADDRCRFLYHLVQGTIVCVQAHRTSFGSNGTILLGLRAVLPLFRDGHEEPFRCPVLYPGYGISNG